MTHYWISGYTGSSITNLGDKLAGMTEWDKYKDKDTGSPIKSGMTQKGKTDSSFALLGTGAALGMTMMVWFPALRQRMSEHIQG